MWVRGRRGVVDGLSSVVYAIFLHMVWEIANLTYHLFCDFDSGPVL